MEVPVQLITSAPKLRLQSADIRIDTAPTTDVVDVMRPVRLGSDATASVTGATLLFNDGDDVLQLSKFLTNSQGARVGVARAADQEMKLSEFKASYRPKRGMPEKPLMDRLTLHAERVALPPVGDRAEPLEITSPLPPKPSPREKPLAPYCRSGHSQRP